MRFLRLRRYRRALLFGTRSQMVSLYDFPSANWQLHTRPTYAPTCILIYSQSENFYYQHYKYGCSLCRYSRWRNTFTAYQSSGSWHCAQEPQHAYRALPYLQKHTYRGKILAFDSYLQSMAWHSRRHVALSEMFSDILQSSQKRHAAHIHRCTTCLRSKHGKHATT